MAILDKSYANRLQKVEMLRGVPSRYFTGSKRTAGIGRGTPFSLVGGFADVIGEPFGSGVLFNTRNSVFQLYNAISLSPKVRNGKANLDNSDRCSTEEIFRDNQVLAGMRIIDLGCGRKPGFALAAQALGADVYTADVEEVEQTPVPLKRQHSIVNFNVAGAGEVLLRATGGSLDLVTTSIIGYVPRTSMFEVAKPETLQSIATPLLVAGGYLDRETVELFQKQ